MPPTHRVHIYASIRVPIEVTAQTYQEAALKAKDLFEDSPWKYVREPAEYAEEYYSIFSVDTLDSKGKHTANHNVDLDDISPTPTPKDIPCTTPTAISPTSPSSSSSSSPA